MSAPEAESEPASVQFADYLEEAFEGIEKDRRMQALDAEIEATLERLRPYLEAVRTQALAESLHRAAFQAFLHGRDQDERRLAQSYEEHTQGRAREAKETADRLREEHREDILHLRMLQRLKELVAETAFDNVQRTLERLPAEDAMAALILDIPTERGDDTRVRRIGTLAYKRPRLTVVLSRGLSPTSTYR